MVKPKINIISGAKVVTMIGSEFYETNVEQAALIAAIQNLTRSLKTR